MHLKLLEKQEQTKPKTSSWKEIIMIRANINEIKTKILYEETMKQKVGT
jgi:fructose-bisphosphate aldolase class 1